MSLGGNSNRSSPITSAEQSDAAELARMRDHWTPRIVAAGAVYVGGFQVAYLYYAYPTLTHVTFYLHLLNICIGLGGLISCRFAIGRIYGRSISLWGLTIIMASMLELSILTGDNDWFYVTLGLISIGASAMMPWEVPWQTALNLATVTIVCLHWRAVADASAFAHWAMIAMGVIISQTATWLGQGYRHQLEEARIDALAASRAKSSFLSSMSHEIRTPMNAVLGMADLLLDTDPSVEQRRYLDVMVSNGNALLDLINSILDLARIESGRMLIEKSEFDLAELIDSTIATFGVAVHTKGLELIAHLAPGVPERLIGDPLRLRQILVNLIGNAIKFTPEGRILLEVSADPESNAVGGLRFAVSDTGIGIPTDKLSTIFASFTQADSSTTRQYGGTGLGLAIVQRLAGLMGGKIWVESVPNEGSTFYFTLEFGVVSRAMLSGPPATLELSGQRVLVVDDNHINRLIVREMMSQIGADVTEAVSGADALEAIRGATVANRPFCIILLDMRMPGMDGLEVARHIREDHLPIEPVVLMLSSEDFKPQAERLRELGLDDYMIKPITRKRLFDSINQLLNHTHRNGTAPARRMKPSSVTPVVSALSKILVVDDSPDNRLLIGAYLRSEPLHVEFAENGNIAVQMFTASRYDLVFMDVQMPEMDGLSATRVIRRWESEQGRMPTPIVALTASALEEDVNRALAAGCDMHISKPVKKRVMIESIRHFAAKVAAQPDSHNAAAR